MNTKRKKIASIIVVLLMALSVFPSTIYAENTTFVMPSNTDVALPPINFTDVPTNHWAYKAINLCVANNLMTGYPNNSFAPEKFLSRAELAQISVKVESLPIKAVSYSYFADVPPDAWFVAPVEAAKGYFITYKNPSGQPTFQPNANVTREGLAYTMAQLRDKQETVVFPDLPTLQVIFKDYDNMGEQFRKNISIAYQRGLMAGYPDWTFRPQKNATRAEVAFLLAKLYDPGTDYSNNGGAKPVITDVDNYIREQIPLKLNSSLTSSQTEYIIQYIKDALNGLHGINVVVVRDTLGLPSDFSLEGINDIYNALK